MEFEIGEFYRTLAGDKAECLHLRGERAIMVCNDEHGGEDIFTVYVNTGMQFSYDKSTRDIVAKWSGPELFGFPARASGTRKAKNGKIAARA